MKEHNKNELDRIKKLRENGRHISALFYSEIERLLDNHKDDLFEGDEELMLLIKTQMVELSCDILRVFNQTSIHPKLWSKFILLLGKHIELMKSEAERIRGSDEN